MDPSSKMFCYIGKDPLSEDCSLDIPQVQASNNLTIMFNPSRNLEQTPKQIRQAHQEEEKKTVKVEATGVNE